MKNFDELMQEIFSNKKYVIFNFCCTFGIIAFGYLGYKYTVYQKAFFGISGMFGVAGAVMIIYRAVIILINRRKNK